MAMHSKRAESHNVGFKIPLTIGRYSITTTPRAKAMESEMQWVTMKKYKRRNDFDYWGMKDKLKRSYTHVHMIEDIWTECRNDEDVRKSDFSRLTFEQIKNFELANILEDMQEEDDIVDPAYVGKKIADIPLPPIQWSQKEMISIRERFQPTLANTNIWLEKRGIELKFFKIGSEEEYIEEPFGKSEDLIIKNK